MYPNRGRYTYRPQDERSPRVRVLRTIPPRGKLFRYTCEGWTARIITCMYIYRHCRRRNHRLTTAYLDLKGREIAYTSVYTGIHNNILYYTPDNNIIYLYVLILYIYILLYRYRLAGVKNVLLLPYYILYSVMYITTSASGFYCIYSAIAISYAL